MNPARQRPAQFLEAHSDAIPQANGFSVESYADRLMDELFEEVESALEMRTIVSEPVASSSPVAQIPMPPTPPSAPAAPETRVLSLAVQPQPAVLSQASDLTSAEIATASATALIEKSERVAIVGQSYDRWLLGVGCASIIVTLALWVISQEAHRPMPASVAPPAQVAASPTVPQGDSQFAQYMQHSLERLDQKSTSPTAPTSSTASALPTVTVPDAPKPAGAPVRTPGGLERIYVPVYQLPPTLLPGGTAVAPLPTVRPVAPPTAVPAPVPLAVPGVARTLKGLADMGDDRSAALIEINGVVQRYRVGESIGSSGWTLVEVAKNQAVIRRNGEVRSVFIGQSF